MHCKFEDVQSGSALEVDLQQDPNGEICEDTVAEQDEQVESMNAE